MNRHVSLILAAVCLTAVVPAATPAGEKPHVVDVGDRRELFVDAHVIESLRGVALRMHSPKQNDVVLRFDKPW